MRKTLEMKEWMNTILSLPMEIYVAYKDYNWMMGLH
jgi:hypothetical protein